MNLADVYSFIKLDLGDIAQSIQAGEEFLRKETRLDILVSQEGVQSIICCDVD